MHVLSSKESAINVAVGMVYTFTEPDPESPFAPISA